MNKNLIILSTFVFTPLLLFLIWNLVLTNTSSNGGFGDSSLPVSIVAIAIQGLALYSIKVFTKRKEQN